MSGCGCLGKIIGFFLGIIFIFDLAIAVWGFNLSSQALKTENYLEPFDQHNVYENITPLILPALSAPPDPRQQIQIGQLDFISVVENLEAEDWQVIAQEVIPADYLQTETEKNLAIALDYINGERVYFDIEFDTSQIRAYLLGQSGDRMVNLIYNTWGNCDEITEAQTRAFLDGEQISFPYCKPQSPETQRQVFALLKQTKDDFASKLPEKWNVRERYAERNKTTLAEADNYYYLSLQRPLALAHELNPLNFLLPCSLLAMITMFAVSSGKGFFMWMGWPLALAGVVVLIPLGIVPLLVSADFGASTAQSQVDAIQREAIRGVVLSWTSVLTTPILVQGAGMVALGFLFMLISALISEDEDDTVVYEMPVSYPYAMPPMTGQTPAGTPRTTQTYSLSSQPTEVSEKPKRGRREEKERKRDKKAESLKLEVSEPIRGQKSEARITRLSINLEEDPEEDIPTQSGQKPS